MIVRAWRKNDKKKLHELVDADDLVLAVDPGARGIALLFEPIRRWTTDQRLGYSPSSPLAIMPLRPYEGLRSLAVVSDELKGEREKFAIRPQPPRLLVVMEESFTGGRENSQSDLSLARQAGAVLGALTTYVMPSMMRAALVTPQTWISSITKTSNRVKRDERKKLTRDFAVRELGADAVADSAPLSPHREAFCDAYAIAHWWGRFSRSVLTRRHPDP